MSCSCGRLLRAWTSDLHQCYNSPHPVPGLASPGYHLLCCLWARQAAPHSVGGGCRGLAADGFLHRSQRFLQGLASAHHTPQMRRRREIDLLLLHPAPGDGACFVCTHGETPSCRRAVPCITVTHGAGQLARLPSTLSPVLRPLGRKGTGFRPPSDAGPPSVRCSWCPRHIGPRTRRVGKHLASGSAGAMSSRRTPSRDPHGRGTLQTDASSIWLPLGTPSHNSAPERILLQKDTADRGRHPW